MSEIRIPARCDNCGQVDDHPKMHYPPYTFHHDCIPAYVLDDLTSETQHAPDGGGGWKIINRQPIPEDKLHPATVKVLNIVAAAKGGKHGPELLAHIRDLHNNDTQED